VPGIENEAVSAAPACPVHVNTPTVSSNRIFRRSSNRELRNRKCFKTLSVMDYETREKRPPTKEEREAKKEKARLEAEQGRAARKQEDEAFRANFERLKAERLARENKS
jgi:hypothetical protein